MPKLLPSIARSSLVVQAPTEYGNQGLLCVPMTHTHTDVNKLREDAARSQEDFSTMRNSTLLPNRRATRVRHSLAQLTYLTYYSTVMYWPSTLDRIRSTGYFGISEMS